MDALRNHKIMITIVCIILEIKLLIKLEKLFMPETVKHFLNSMTIEKQIRKCKSCDNKVITRSTLYHDDFGVTVIYKQVSQIVTFWRTNVDVLNGYMAQIVSCPAQRASSCMTFVCICGCSLIKESEHCQIYKQVHTSAHR